LKTWLFSIVGLIVFIGLSLFNQISLERNTGKLGEKLQMVEKAIETGNWPKASQELEAVQKNWQKIKPVWSLLLHHREIDAIEQALIRTKRSIQAQDETAARVEQGSLGEYIEHIPKREKFSLVNIL
jgi:HAMP domain-containing protein